MTLIQEKHVLVIYNDIEATGTCIGILYIIRVH
jgi:hypothetical protein